MKHQMWSDLCTDSRKNYPRNTTWSLTSLQSVWHSTVSYGVTVVYADLGLDFHQILQRQLLW